MRIITACWKALCSLPRSWHQRIAVVIGALVYLLAKDRRRIAAANINACMPSLTSHKKVKLLKANFFFLGLSILDTGVAWFWSNKKIKASISYRLDGLEHLNSLNNQGNLIFFKHSQHLELDARLLAMHAEVYGVARSHNSSEMDSLQTNGRLSSIKDTANKNNPRKFMKWLKGGKNVLYAIDQDYGWTHSSKLRFFNQEAATITTAAKILALTNCNLLFLNSYYDQHELVLEMSSIDPADLTPDELSQKINNLMEAKITTHPAEYLWAHRRFKSTLGKAFYKTGR